MAKIHINAHGQRVAQDKNGSWRQVNKAGEPKGPYAESPFKNHVPEIKADISKAINQVEIYERQAQTQRVEKTISELRGEVERLASIIDALKIYLEDPTTHWKDILKYEEELHEQLFRKLDVRIAALFSDENKHLNGVLILLADQFKGVIAEMRSVKDEIQKLKMEDIGTIRPKKPDEIAIKPSWFERFRNGAVKLGRGVSWLFRSMRERLQSWRARRRASAAPRIQSPKVGSGRIAVVACVILVVALGLQWYSISPKTQDGKQQQQMTKVETTTPSVTPDDISKLAEVIQESTKELKGSVDSITQSVDGLKSDIRSLNDRADAVDKKVNTPVPDSYYADLRDAIAGDK
ncbi:MAG: hypothetical protein KGH79_00195 [Patescibacteria group bacterium]|nr:hypothetical protein [Patescibacteria group bacterium]